MSVTLRINKKKHMPLIIGTSVVLAVVLLAVLQPTLLQPEPKIMAKLTWEKPVYYPDDLNMIDVEAYVTFTTYMQDGKHYQTIESSTGDFDEFNVAIAELTADFDYKEEDFWITIQIHQRADTREKPLTSNEMSVDFDTIMKFRIGNSYYKLTIYEV